MNKIFLKDGRASHSDAVKNIFHIEGNQILIDDINLPCQSENHNLFQKDGNQIDSENLNLPSKMTRICLKDGGPNH